MKTTTVNVSRILTKKGLTITQVKEWARALENDPWEETRGILKPYHIVANRYQKKLRKELERS